MTATTPTDIANAVWELPLNWSDDMDRWPCNVCKCPNSVEPDMKMPYCGWCVKCGALSKDDANPFRETVGIWRVQHPKAKAPLFTGLGDSGRKRAEEFLAEKNNPDLRLFEMPLYTLGDPALAFDRTPAREEEE